MLYIIKFLYNSFLLPPGIFILAMVLLGFYLFKIKKDKKSAIAIFSVAFMLYITSIHAFAGVLMRNLESSYYPPKDFKADAGAIVVLGGGATPDTPNIGSKGHLSGTSISRLVTAVKIHNRTNLPVIVTGGKVFCDSGNEADIARRQLLELGIKPRDIIVENQSRTTQENAIYTSRILKNMDVKKVILVTSAYHMKRSVFCFKKTGIGTIPFPTDYSMSIKAKLHFNLFAPSYGGLSTTGVALHEYLGLLALYF